MGDEKVDAPEAAKLANLSLSGDSKKFNWADEASEEPAPTPAAAQSSKLEDSQKDGSTTFLNGSGLDEPEFDVNVQLADLQDDPNNPLYSVKSFDELNL